MKAGQMPGLALAIVTDPDDPLGQGRVKLRFPWLDESLESDWVPVAAPFAGPDRGFFVFPEVGDEVVVGFLHGDFEHPVMLGALWNGQSEAPSPDPRQRMLRSKNGHTIRLIDSTPNAGDLGAMIFEDAYGNLITMSNGLVTVRSKATLVLQAPNIVINGRPVVPSRNPI
jgi:phage baseplate assembly protein V